MDSAQKGSETTKTQASIPAKLGNKPNFLFYHFSIALPNFIATRPEHIVKVMNSFDIPGLVKHLFSPYRRLTAKSKTTLVDKISFNLISAGIGFIVRSVLIIAGIVLTVLIAGFDYISIIFYAVIPIFSWSDYEHKISNTFFDRDLTSPTSFVNKLTKTMYLKQLALFFEPDFSTLIYNLPLPKTIGIEANQTYTEMINCMIKNWPPLKDYLETKSIKVDEFKSLAEFIAKQQNVKPVPKLSSVGQMLAYGYTNNLDRFGHEMTALPATSSTINHEILEKISQIISRPQANNVLLVGEPGVGKHSILESLAHAITSGSLPPLYAKRLIVLDTLSILSSSKVPTEVKSNFESIIAEAKSAGNIILAFEQIDRIATNQDSRFDLSEIFSNLLTDNSLPIIGTTTIDDFNKYIRPNANLTNLFEKVDVDETSEEQTTEILLGKALQLYRDQKVSILFSAILEIVKKSNQLMPDRSQPEKSILILQDAAGIAKNNKQNQITKEIVDEILAEKTKTPIGKLTEGEAEKLTDLETVLHKRIVGQNEAITEIARAMRRARAELEKGTRPMGSFLFLGPTGVGKTETAKALAQTYFGSDDKMVRVDMSEYQGEDSINRLIGNLETKTPGHLANLVREHPFGLLLLDEFEKANHEVQNLFLQVLDEGNLTDAFGKKVSFTNIIIIATSNAGAEFIREEVEKGTIDLNKKLIDNVLSKGLFTPELVNRFDGVIVYHPLTREEVVKVAKLMLENLSKDLKESKNITLEVNDTLAEKVAEKGFVVAFGARPIRRLIQDKIEDEIAKEIISGKVKNGDKILSSAMLGYLT